MACGRRHRHVPVEREDLEARAQTDPASSALVPGSMDAPFQARQLLASSRKAAYTHYPLLVTKYDSSGTWIDAVGHSISWAGCCAHVEAQECMTTAQLLENGQSENAYAAAMFVVAWAAGTAEQLQLRAENLTAADAGSEQVEWLNGLATCMMNNIEVADLSAAPAGTEARPQRGSFTERPARPCIRLPR